VARGGPPVEEPYVCCRLAVAAAVASSAAYVTGKLAELVGHASYVTALAIAKSMPGHKKKSQGEGLQLLQHGHSTVLPSMQHRSCTVMHHLEHY